MMNKLKILSAINTLIKLNLICFIPINAEAALLQNQTPGKEITFKVEEVILDDMQGLQGGKILFLHNDGRVFCQSVSRSGPNHSFIEKRYQISVSQNELDSLSRTIEDHSFFHISIPERAGIPEESRPSIMITLSTGESRTVSKWGNDKHLDFDAVYMPLLNLAQKCMESNSYFTGQYNSHWSPDGFKARR